MRVNRTIFNAAEGTLGNVESLYNRIKWSKGHIPKQKKFIQKGTVSNTEYGQRFESLSLIPEIPYDNSVFNYSLETIRTKVGGSEFKDDGFWSAQITEDENGRITLSDGIIYKEMSMNVSDPFAEIMTHPHNVFDSVSFKNIVVTLEFDTTTADKYIHKLYLDSTAIISGSDKTKVGTPSLFPAKRMAGTDGVLNGIHDYQMGVSQMITYVIRCGDKFVTLNIQLSFVFMYPRSDFDPGGNVLANKFYPQVTFYSYAQMLEPRGYEGSDLDLTSLLPTNVHASTAIISDYSVRVKMVVNNESSHHIVPSEPLPDGLRRDKNHLWKFRQDFPVTKIPSKFEKIILEKYVEEITYLEDGIIKSYDSVTGNIVGFFSDGNRGGILPSGALDNRLKPNFTFDPVPIPNTDILPFQGTPFWQNIFDYSSYNVEKEKEFIAVYGNNSHKLNSAISDSLVKSTRTRDFPYPDLSGTKGISLKKYPRQGAYDNIHLHGYLGHYKDNEKMVIHAPICGYCCFHMHWRWSTLNYVIAQSTAYQWASKGMTSASQVKPKNYLGWDPIKPQSTDIFIGASFDQQLRGVGMPLIPYNQQLKIAVSDPDTEPYSEEYEVIHNGSSIKDLHLSKKAIWYSINLENTGFDSKHSIMEHGCGYAVDYDKYAKAGIEGSVYAWTRSALEECVTEVLGTDASSFTEFLFSIRNPIDSAINISKRVFPFPFNKFNYSSGGPTLFKYNDLYEILYRLIHFYNSLDDDFNGTNSPNIDYRNYDQIPTNNSTETNASYIDISDMENL